MNHGLNGPANTPKPLRALHSKPAGLTAALHKGGYGCCTTCGRISTFVPRKLTGRRVKKGVIHRAPPGLTPAMRHVSTEYLIFLG